MLPNGNERVVPEVTDISSDSQLLSFAAAGQLALLLRRFPGFSQGRIAYAAGLGGNPRSAGPALTTAIRQGPTDPAIRKAG
jgi:hypothetical protein